MILPDVNVLIYAFRSEMTQHGICRPWLERVVQGPSAFGVSRLALGAVVRITTNRRSFSDAETSAEAFAGERPM